MGRRSMMLLGLLTLPVIGLAACNALVTRLQASHAESVRTMHREARALIPAGARLVEETESACVELRSYPSCVIVSFDLPGTDEARERAMQERLRTRGWTPAPGAPSFAYERDDLRASVRIQRRTPLWEEHCADRLASELDQRVRDECLDSVSIRVT